MKRARQLPKLQRLHGNGSSASEIVLQGRDAPKVLQVPTATHVVWTMNSFYEIDLTLGKIRRVGGIYSPTERVGLGWKPYMSFEAVVGCPALICWATQDGIIRATETSVVQAIETICAAGE